MSPSYAKNLQILPLSGDLISTLTLSVSITAIISSNSAKSPSSNYINLKILLANSNTEPSVIESPIVGI